MPIIEDGMIFNLFKQKKCAILGPLLCLILGTLAGLLSGSGSSEWYRHLSKPWFNPPAFVFGPVWSILYILMGLALSKIWQGGNRKLLALFILQFIVNLCWPFAFFYGQSVEGALFVVVLLWLVLAWLLRALYKERLIFEVGLLLPYFLWVTFAFILNYSLLILNK